MTSEYLSSDFSYKKYSLEQLDNWVNDALNCEDLTPQDIYDTIVKCVNESVECHKKYLTKSVELLSLLKGHREVDFGVGNDEPWEYDAAGGKFPRPTKKDWVDFWEETYYPEEHSKEQVREFEAKERDYEALRAKLDAGHEKSKYYFEYDRNDLNRENPFKDKELEEIRKEGGFEWTPGT